MSVRILTGDCRDVLATLPSGSAQTCVTSPPYFGLRDYGHTEQIGQEADPTAYVGAIVEVFRGVHRVLRDDGTAWLNIGDSYAATTKTPGRNDAGRNFTGGGGNKLGSGNPGRQHVVKRDMEGAKPKDLLMIPARVALALQTDGWYLRSDIIWHKPNPMPESVTDRPTSAHEHVFLFSKNSRYFYDANAVRERREPDSLRRSTLYGANPSSSKLNPDRNDGGRGGSMGFGGNIAGRNLHNVWTIAAQPFRGAHFATMPRGLVERCILAGSRSGDTVLDPFGGAGTTGLVADRLGRSAVLIELNPAYAAMARDRVTADAGLFAEVAS